MPHNLKGAFNCIQSCLPPDVKAERRTDHQHLLRFRVMGNAGQANYCASKAGVIGMTKSVARELASRGITVERQSHPDLSRTDDDGCAVRSTVKRAMRRADPMKALRETRGHCGGQSRF
ncbi:MAG: SDR family NAD(P)-dependent oxidoreductase [Roseburia sp.]